MITLISVLVSVIVGIALIIGDNARGVEWFILGVLWMILAELEKINAKNRE